ncbi:MAG: ribosome silencing factor [Oscillospiraceae bacterium]|nr:ribosome silencing factor [Oscillospiraceae bacterium]
MEPKTLTNLITGILDEKKGVDIAALAVGDMTIVADYFVIVTGTSNTHINALSDAVQEKLAKEHAVLPRCVEGRASGWVVLDYASVLVHIFGKEEREHYNLERLFPNSAV